MNPFHLCSGLLMLAIAATHVFAGGRVIVPPLFAARGIHEVARQTHYYCWHLVSITLAALSGAFLWAAFDEAAWHLAALATMVSAAFAAWGWSLVGWRRLHPLHHPQGALFLLPLAPQIAAWAVRN